MRFFIRVSSTDVLDAIDEVANAGEMAGLAVLA